MEKMMINTRLNFKRKRTGQGRATLIVFLAVKAGLLKNLKKVNIICKDCHVERAIHWEHRDYNNPLKVEPVCRKCNYKRGCAIPKVKRKLKIEKICKWCNQKHLLNFRNLCKKCALHHDYLIRKNNGYYNNK